MENKKNIGESKLVTLLQTFEQWEWYRLEAFVASPYHNTQEELVKLVAFFSKHRHGLSALNKQAIHRAVLGGTAFEERNINYWLSDLGKLTEQFLGIERHLKKAHHAEVENLSALTQRGMDKHVEFLRKKKERQLEAQDLRDVDDFLWPRFQFYMTLSENTYRKGTRKVNEHLQKAADALDSFYVAEKLRLTCSMLNHQRVIASDYELNFIREIESFLKANPSTLEQPVVALYFSIFNLLKTEDTDTFYPLFIEYLKKHQTAFSQKELTTLHEYGLNICAREIRQQRQQYVLEAFRLYKSGLELGLFLDNGILSPWHFKNIVRLGLRTKEIGWTEQFIKEKSELLSPDFQQDALHFNLAELYFSKGDYDNALVQLNQVEFTDLYYNVDAKVMLAKIYKARDLDDALESLLHAFKAFLRRNKALPPDTQKAYMNFVKLLSKIQKTQKSKLPELRKKIESTKLLVFKDWLLEWV